MGAQLLQWYNGEHRHSAIRYVTPNERHRGEDENILKRREVVYAAAKQRHPARWSGKTRNWNRVEEVWLNPPKEHQTAKGQNSRAA
jgi:putative transposase